jgi:hypothetical protein
MIIHYITGHKYLPPTEFVGPIEQAADAESSPAPRSHKSSPSPRSRVRSRNATRTIPHLWPLARRWDRFARREKSGRKCPRSISRHT